MDAKPILIFPRPNTVGRRILSSRPPRSMHYPPVERQRERLEPAFDQLERVFEARRVELQGNPTGAQPEQVLVLETIGSVEDFIRAVRRIPGLEWLGEWDKYDIPADEDFYVDDEHRDKPLSGRLYMVMSNHQAMREVISLWNRYNTNPQANLGFGRAKWKLMFKQLKNIRTWDVSDRLLETGLLEDWRERVQFGQDILPFEIELWFRANDDERRRAKQEIEGLVGVEGGSILHEVTIPEIAYHAILAQLPVKAVQSILSNRNTQLLHSGYVMFFRPVGQASVVIPDELSSEAVTSDDGSMPEGNPVVALLDGLPLENHRLLAGRLIVDDPDNWSADYPGHERVHGTAMASLISRGELDANEPPLKSPIYVRPILKPNSSDWRPRRDESIPDDILSVDLVHRAVHRMFERDGTLEPVAPTVRIINLSVGDPSRLFDRALSPWAKLLDWLAWRYKVLFIVSAGNHPTEIVLEVPRDDLGGLEPSKLEEETIKAIANDARNRRLLSPAEAINVLTVGATQSDHSVPLRISPRINPFTTNQIPNPCNALGLGYRRSVKPDILMPGGRQLYVEKLGSHTRATLTLNPAVAAPGQKVASPSPVPGDLSSAIYTRGTSNAAALATRTAAQIFEVLRQLQQEEGGDLLEDNYAAVLSKAMLVHGANWGESFGILERALRTPENSQKFREHVSRFLGYGIVQPERVYSCTDQRATLLGCGSLKDGEAHEYLVPLPPSLSGKRLWRRMTITLAWLTPINPSNRAYRRAVLWFEPPTLPLQVQRREVDGNAVLRGTVQHEVLEGDRASAYVDGTALNVKVNCRSDAGGLDDAVPYGLVVSLEVAEGQEVAVYEEIRARIRPAVPITPKVSLT